MSSNLYCIIRRLNSMELLIEYLVILISGNRSRQLRDVLLLVETVVRCFFLHFTKKYEYRK